MSVYMTFFAGTAPIGAFLAGLIADKLGTPTSMAFGGAISLAAAIGVAIYFGAWRPDAPALRFSSPGRSEATARAAHSGSRD